MPTPLNSTINSASATRCLVGSGACSRAVSTASVLMRRSSEWWKRKNRCGFAIGFGSEAARRFAGGVGGRFESVGIGLCSANGFELYPKSRNTAPVRDVIRRKKNSETTAPAARNRQNDRPVDKMGSDPQSPAHGRAPRAKRRASCADQNARLGRGRRRTGASRRVEAARAGSGTRLDDNHGARGRREGKCVAAVTTRLPQNPRAV